MQANPYFSDKAIRRLQTVETYKAANRFVYRFLEMIPERTTRIPDIKREEWVGRKAVREILQNPEESVEKKEQAGYMLGEQLTGMYVLSVVCAKAQASVQMPKDQYAEFVRTIRSIYDSSSVMHDWLSPKFGIGEVRQLFSKTDKASLLPLLEHGIAQISFMDEEKQIGNLFLDPIQFPNRKNDGEALHFSTKAVTFCIKTFEKMRDLLLQAEQKE